MFKAIILAVVLMAPGAPASAQDPAVPLVPNPALTPGAVDPAATKDVICVAGYTSRPGVRHVTAATKRKVFAEYGVDPKGPGSPFEVDHLISLELGGSNDIGNLWPQSYVTEPYNAHLKDALENRLHALVCAGQLNLAMAQLAISTAWAASYLTYVGPLPAK
jgi:hypothetical protein